MCGQGQYSVKVGDEVREGRSAARQLMPALQHHVIPAANKENLKSTGGRVKHLVHITHAYVALFNSTFTWKNNWGSKFKCFFILTSC